MTRKIFGFLFLVSFIQLASGCLDSPLMNHADADSVTGGASDKGGCQMVFNTQGLCASLTWIKEQDDESAGEFELRFWKRDEGTEFGPYVTPNFPVSVKLWMASMGHGSSPVTVSPALDSSEQAVPGVFRATNVYFVMGGKWEIWVQLKQGNKMIDRAKIDYSL